MSYQKELEKYRDIDEDEIMRGMSEAELAQLDLELQEMDPEVRSFHILNRFLAQQ